MRTTLTTLALVAAVIFFFWLLETDLSRTTAHAAPQPPAPPRFSWSVASSHALTLMPIGDRSTFRWEFDQIPLNETVRVRIAAEEDVQLSDNAGHCTSHGSEFSVDCKAPTPLILIIQDARIDPVAIAASVISSKARDTLASPNHVRIELLRWTCIENCPAE